jgi:LacI family transcriptional regulator
VILSPHSAQTDISALRDGSIPCVVIDRTLGEAVDSVLVDSRSSAREATLHLLAEGWESPACVTGPQDASTAMERRRGYEDALRERGLSGREKISHQPFKSVEGRAAAAALLDSGDPPDSFFIANATLALGVLAELSERGLQLGRDVGVVTFDDPPWAPLLNPPVSVVSQPAYDIGTEAARLLMSRIQGDGPPIGRKTTLATTLIVRDSSRRHGPDPLTEKAS